MSSALPAHRQSAPDFPAQESETSSAIAQDARQTLAKNSRFRGHTQTINIECDRDRLIINGRVPSFYLKQMLQEVLLHVDGVEQIDNRVDVVCPDGLSSVPRDCDCQEME